MNQIARKVKTGTVVSVTDLQGLTVSEWAHRIRFGMRQNIDAVLYLARELKRAQSDFQDQQEGGEIKSWRRAYSDMLNEAGLSSGKAASLIRVSESQNLKNVDKAFLPEGWSTLEQLAELPESVFKEAVRDGRITPQITKKIIREMNPNRQENKRPAANKQKKSKTYNIDKAHDFFVTQLKADVDVGILEMVNIIADAGIDPNLVIAKIEEELL